MTVIDAWAQHPGERFLRQPWLATLHRWTRREDLSELPIETTLTAMDAGGVDRALLSAWVGPGGDVLIDNADVAAHVAAHPDRFAGIASVDLSRPVEAVRQLRHAVDGLGMIALRIVPWLWNLPPDDRRYYPLYTACVELGIPLCTQVGHTGPLFPSEPGRPIPYLDTVLLEFPDLVVVGGHVGYPWIDEVLSLAIKYPNFHIDTSAYAVHRLPAALVDYLRGAGRARVLFGTNWPMLSAQRCLERLDDLHLDDEARGLFLGGNAARVFALDA